MKTASILTIGDELLIGQVIDTNSAWLGTELNQLGIDVALRMAVGDSEASIVHGLEQCLEKGDFVLVTGGLGPTNDDMTIQVLARYFDQELVLHQETYDHIHEIFAGRQIPFTDGHMQQCMLPVGAEILKNRLGTAPGMLFKHLGKWVISMPGVPYEMKGIMADHILPRLKSIQKDNHILHSTIRTAGIAESVLAHEISDIEAALPDSIKMAYLPSVHQVRIRLTGHGAHMESLETEIAQVKDKIIGRIGKYIYGYDDDTLVSVVGNLCREHDLNLGTAESCTGGTVASMIVQESGVSSFFKGGIVAYANILKEHQLGVKLSTLETKGAVSKETVEEMVDGALKLLGVDVAIAISGIAGPDGGTPEKPVGTIWICVGNAENKTTHLIQGSRNRSKNIQYASTYALNLMRKFLIAQYNK